MNTYKDEVLMHYGIKGQKKGRRRFQNPDGSLTAAGKLRYLDPSSKKNTGSYVRLKEEDKKSDAENGYLRTNSIWPEIGEPGAKSAFTSMPAHGSTVKGDSHVQLYSDSKNTYERYYNPDGSIEERVHSKDGKTTKIRKWKKDGTIIEDGTLAKDGQHGRSPILEYMNPAKVAVNAAVQSANLATARKKAYAESERYRKMTERGKKQIEAENKKKEQQQSSSKESYRVLPAKENGTVTFTHKSKDGSFTSWYYNSKNGSVVKEIIGKDGKVVSRKALSAKDPEYIAYADKGKRALGATNSQKSIDNLRMESAAKAKQKLTPEKADKIKKALAEKRTKKAAVKPNVKKNRYEEIQ